MPLDDETAARFDHMMLPLTQQVAAMANGENAIDMMLDLYFSFLRRKTDFFSPVSYTHLTLPTTSRV